MKKKKQKPKQENPAARGLINFFKQIQKKLAPGEHSMTIANACKKWPDSKSRAFSILNGGDAVYFMIDDWPEYYRKNEAAITISSFKAIKILPNGQIFKTQVTIKLQHEINPITFKHFAEYCEASIKKIKDSTEYAQHTKDKILQSYEELLGFKTK